MKYETVIFDLDGTVLDTLGDLAASVNFALKKHGLPERTTDEIRSFVGNGIKNLVFLSAGDGADETEKENILADFRAHYSVHCADITAPYDGITGLLDRLKENGVKTAVVSNKADPAVQTLAGKFFPGSFSFVAGEKPGVPRKPAPDSVFAALEVLCASAENAVYVGDSEVDIITAANSGLPCISVTWGFRGKNDLVAAGAGVLAESAAELEKLLL